MSGLLSWPVSTNNRLVHNTEQARVLAAQHLPAKLALPDIKDIDAFRKHAKALNLVVRIPKAVGKGYDWRSKHDILADYTDKIEDGKGSPMPPAEGPPVALAD